MSPLTIFDALDASRLSTIIVGCSLSPFFVSLRNGSRLSVPDMTFQLRANLNLPVLFAFAAKNLRSEEFQVYMLTFFYGGRCCILKTC
jgi:hypothetical protein